MIVLIMSTEKSIKALGNAAKGVAIGLGILILTSFVAVYGMNMFLDKPIYENYCEEFSRPAVELDMEQEIENKECLAEYDLAREQYTKILFIISVPLGILIIALGVFIFSLSSVGVGIMLGGVYTLIYGAANYWRYGEDWMRFLVSLIGLVALVLIAYRFSRKK